MNYAESDRRLTALKKETDWLYDVSCVPLQQGLRDLQRAFVNFFNKRTAFPSFKKKSSRQSARYTKSAFKVKDAKLQLGRMPGLVKVKWSRDLPSEPTSATVIQESDGRYFVSFAVQVEPTKFEPRDKAVGLDVGITHMVARSDGYLSGKIDFSKDEKKLAKLQRKLSRALKRGKNRSKLRKKVARHYARMADKRMDFHHKEALKIVKRYDEVYAEDLGISSMVKNRHLSKHISFAGWGQFLNMVEYKLDWYGGTLASVPAAYTSQRCPECGHVERDNRNGERFQCLSCGHLAHADVNGAINIMAAGQAVTASEVSNKTRNAPALSAA